MRFSYQYAPWRSRRAAARSPASADRAAARFSLLLDAGAGEVLEDPADPGGAAVESDMHGGGGVCRRFPPGVVGVPDVPQPHGRAACGLRVARVAGRRAA